MTPQHQGPGGLAVGHGGRQLVEHAVELVGNALAAVGLRRWQGAAGIRRGMPPCSACRPFHSGAMPNPTRANPSANSPNDPNAQTHCVAFSQTFHLGSVWPKVARGTFRMASCRGTPSGGPRGIGSRGLSGSMRSAHARPLAGSCSELALTNTTELRRRASTVSETDGRRGGCGAAGGRLDLTNPGGGGFRGTTTPGGAMPSGHAPKQVQE